MIPGKLCRKEDSGGEQKPHSAAHPLGPMAIPIRRSNDLKKAGLAQDPSVYLRPLANGEKHPRRFLRFDE